MSTGAMRAATHARHYEQAPDMVEPDGTPSWVTRARNFVVAVSEVKPDAVLDRRANPDESLLLLPPDVAATIEAGSERIDSSGDSLSILPPGASRITARSVGIIVRVFSCK